MGEKQTTRKRRFVVVEDKAEGLHGKGGRRAGGALQLEARVGNCEVRHFVEVGSGRQPEEGGGPKWWELGRGSRGVGAVLVLVEEEEDVRLRLQTAVCTLADRRTIKSSRRGDNNG